MNRKVISGIRRWVGVVFVLFMLVVCSVPIAYAVDVVPLNPVGGTSGTNSTNTNGATQNVDIRSPGFKLVVCDGPAANGAPKNNPDGTPYIPCDFKGVILTVKHFLNIAMVLAVFGAIGTAAYAGGLYVTGKESNITKAKEMLPKVGIGFVLMLTAWFIVAQVLTWLTDNAAFKTFLKL